jgi:Spy/CpxP family protein refolding chaperone
MHRFELVGFFGALVAALTLSGVSFARPPFEPGDSHRDPGAFIEENAEALDLDEETLSAIRSIVEESKDRGDQLHSKLRELHKGMKALLAQDSPDESAVMQQVDSIGAAEVEMQRHRLGTMLKIRALLTPEQREEMTRLREDSRGRWRQALLEDCEADLEALCPEADDRWSRKQCLRDNREKISEACRDAVKAAKSARHGSHKGCPGHQGADCPMHQGADCPMHQGADCPMHQGEDCPMHRGADCPMRQGADCPMHQGAGSSEKPEPGDAY